MYLSIDRRSIARNLAHALATLALVAGTSSSLVAEDWPSFHGPGGLGKANATLPNTWTKDDYAWRLPLGSVDVGSIAIVGDQAYLLSFDVGKSSLVLMAVNIESGKPTWRRPFPIGEYHRHKRNSYAASTPTVDGDSIYIAYADNDHTWLRCLSLDGQERWARDFGPWQSDHGFSTSPRVAGSMVLLYDSQQAEQLEPGQKPAHERIIAVDAKTGADLWETPLKATRTNYGLPAVYRSPSGLLQVIGAGTGNGIFGIDAKSGEKLWQVPVLDKRSVSSPLIVGDLAIASCGSGGGGNILVAVKIPDTAKDQPEVAFRVDRAASYVPTCAVDGDYLMMIADNGIVSRIRLPDGETVWSKRIGGNFGASPIVVGDKLLLISLDGLATILASSNQYSELGSVDLGGSVGASPAVGGGKLLIRVADELVCLPLGKST
jgi:outer membrane protein assembly factor BamB